MAKQQIVRGPLNPVEVVTETAPTFLRRAQVLDVRVSSRRQSMAARQLVHDVVLPAVVPFGSLDQHVTATALSGDDLSERRPGGHAGGEARLRFGLRLGQLGARAVRS